MLLYPPKALAATGTVAPVIAMLVISEIADCMFMASIGGKLIGW